MSQLIATVAALMSAQLASAQPVSSVAPGVSVVTVMVCAETDGCTAEWQALGDYCTALGVPLLDFDDVVAAGPGGGDARAALDDALLAAAGRPDLARLETARSALKVTPLTLPSEEPFLVWLRLGAARLGKGDIAGADDAFQAAASSSGARVYDLPDGLSGEAIDRYLVAAGKRPEASRLTVTADHPAAVVYVDGQPVGAAPVELELPSGWHRVTVERPGRRTAWVGEIIARPGAALGLSAEIAADDAPAALEQAVVGAIAGTPPAPESAALLAAWGKDRGLSKIRFVSLEKPKPSGMVPEERVAGPGGALWDLRAAWLDVGSQRFLPRGPGPSTLRAAADPERFTMGLGLGYVRLAHQLNGLADPHDHLTLELVGLVKLNDLLAIDARVGLWRAAQPWYLYDDWLARELVPVAAGVRLSDPTTGLYVGAQGVAIVPLAVGAQLLGGWVWRPTTRWRIGTEGRGGYTDQGALYGGAVSVGFAG